MYLRGAPDYLHEEWLTKSGPIYSEKIIIGHLIRDRDDSAYFDLLENFNVGLALIAIYLLSFCGILAFALLINELNHRVQFGTKSRMNILKQITSAMDKFQNKRLTAISLFLLFVHLFLWLTQLFLTNSIKTNKVVGTVRDFCQ